MKRSLLLIVLLVAVGGVFAVTRLRPKTDEKISNLAQVDEQAAAIYKKANQACRALTSGSFEAELVGEGVQEPRIEKAKGTIIFDAAAGRMRISVTTSRANAPERRYDLSNDGGKIYALDHTVKTHLTGTFPYDQRLLTPGLALMMPEFGSEEAFPIRRGHELKYEGVQNAGTEPCDVVLNTAAGEAIRWFFSKADSLPRRMEHIINLYADPNSKDKTVRTISKLTPRTQIAQAEFQIEAPEGFSKTELSPPEPLLAAGTPAPPWELRSPDGKTVRLADLRGQVVVLDFWATWCGPCKVAMPKVQELHAQYEGRRVKVFGVNCMENRTGDPENYMKSQKYTYGLLLNGDRVAEQYNVNSIPTFYVIDGEGNIVYSYSGGDKEAELKEAVRKAVEKQQT